MFVAVHVVLSGTYVMLNLLCCVSSPYIRGYASVAWLMELISMMNKVVEKMKVHAAQVTFVLPVVRQTFIQCVSSGKFLLVDSIIAQFVETQYSMV